MNRNDFDELFYSAFESIGELFIFLWLQTPSPVLIESSSGFQSNRIFSTQSFFSFFIFQSNQTYQDHICNIDLVPFIVL